MYAQRDHTSQNPHLPSVWTAAHVAQIGAEPAAEINLLSAADARPIIPGLFLWDAWPVQLDDGSTAEIAGGILWIILSAPRGPDPDDRHDHARMRLLHQRGDAWIDCGNLLPDGFSPGKREWSGSARINPATGDITLWFTAAGVPGKTGFDVMQRLFQATGTLDMSGAHPSIRNWRHLTETVRNDGALYADLAITQGVPGRIKGFRDPYWFRDPADGRGYILFCGSQSIAQSGSDHDGVIGIAAASDAAGVAEFTLLPHLVDGIGVVNELELPHMLERGGNYYLFWSSQRSVFVPGAASGPTGLYGMVGPGMFGPFTPLNGTGLVLQNPAAEPRQNYAWKVMSSLDVVSFVDYWGLSGRDIAGDAALKSEQFGGTIAPLVKIALDGNKAHIVRT